MDATHINWLAVLVAGISSFVVGGIWYSPGLFGKAWMRENNLIEDDIKKGNKGKIFGFTAIFSLIMAANLKKLASYLYKRRLQCCCINTDGCYYRFVEIKLASSNVPKFRFIIDFNTQTVEHLNTQTIIKKIIAYDF